jgi:hypothetical protein
MTEISTIIRARLDEGRAIADEDVRALLNENRLLRAALREIKNKSRTGRPPFMSSKTDYFQIASMALGEKEQTNDL